MTSPPRGPAVDHVALFRHLPTPYMVMDLELRYVEATTPTSRPPAAPARTWSLSEAPQRSLLTAPPQPQDLRIAVRYRPAAQEAQVGGDRYDAFVTHDGSTLAVIGDVSGHDRNAAAAMGQVRTGALLVLAGEGGNEDDIAVLVLQAR